MADEFDDPTQAPSGDKVSMDTFVGKLIIVKPVEYTDSMKTEYKPDGAEAVFANIAILDGHEGEPWKIFRRVLVMQGYLVGAFKNSVGASKNPLLGTIYLGQRKSGQKPPFMYQSLKDKPKPLEIARAWMAEHRDELLAAPEPEFGEPEKTAGKSTLDAMRTNNQWLDDEPPF